MFTRQRKSRPIGTPAPFTQHRIGVTPKSSLTKRKAVVFADELPPPPLGSLTDSGGDVVVASSYAEDWERFRQVELLDEAERKDDEAMLEKISKLEKELYHYRYHMGLLLIENQKGRQKLAETEELLKMHQSSSQIALSALSEVQKREENLRKALSLERQCVADLLRALHAMQEEKDSTVNKKLHDAEPGLLR